MAEMKRGFPSVWRFLVSLGVAALTAIATSGLAFADGPLGSTAAPGTTGGCQADGADVVQISTAGTQYSLPADGQITSWSTLGGLAADPPNPDPSVRLELWRHSSGLVYSLVDISDVADAVTVPQDGTLHTYTLNRPLQGQAGDLLGFWWTGFTLCWTLTSTDSYGFAYDSSPASGATVTFWQLGGLLNVAANFVAKPTFLVPQNADQCKHDGWGLYADAAGTPFKNQGDCVSWVETNGSNPPAGG